MSHVVHKVQARHANQVALSLRLLSVPAAFEIDWVLDCIDRIMLSSTACSQWTRSWSKEAYLNFKVAGASLSWLIGGLSCWQAIHVKSKPGDILLAGLLSCSWLPSSSDRFCCELSNLAMHKVSFAQKKSLGGRCNGLVWIPCCWEAIDSRLNMKHRIKARRMHWLHWHMPVLSKETDNNANTPEVWIKSCKYPQSIDWLMHPVLI